jgi:hypothetical protein
MPAPIAITTASTDAHTDAAPLTPQNQGARWGARRRAMRIPSGKAIPIRKPIGKRSAIDRAMRTGVEDASKRCVTSGVRRPKAMRIAIVRIRRRRIAACGWAMRAVDRLPTPLETSSENSTTDRLYDG